MIEKTQVSKVQDNVYRLQTPAFDTLQQAEFHFKFLNNRLVFHHQIRSIPHIQNNDIIRMIEQSIIQSQLINLQHSFSHTNTLEFYTDGSLIDPNTPYVSNSFALLQTHHSAPNFTFVATIEKWPTILRSELAAIVTAILISPSNATITINTDSKSVIDHYNYIISNRIQYNYARKIFKEATNNILWITLLDLITKKNINLQFNKIKAHSGNLNNDLVDELAKRAHNYNSPPIVFKEKCFTQIKYFPLWKGYIVEQNLQKFITNISRNRGFEHFINLQRNHKYKDLSIAWEAIFFSLADDEDKLVTSIYASSRKAHRIKLMLNELPTIQQMIKRRPDLYDGWNCPMCKQDKETWEHIFTCQNHVPIIRTIIFNNRKKLMSLIEQFTTRKVINRDFDHYSLWLYYPDDALFTFIDIIKGFVPLFLYETIFEYVGSKKVTLAIISVFVNNVYIDFMEKIWKPRCTQQLIDEVHAGIDKKEKKKKCSQTRSHSNTNRSNNNYNIELEGINNSIVLGGEWLSY